MSWACSLLPFVLLLITLTALEFSSADKAEPKVSVTRGKDGHMSTSINIKNTTCRAIKDLSLQIDIHAVMDDTEKDEEIKGLWSVLCPETGEELINIVPRTEWGGKENIVRQRRSQRADLLIVDGHGYTTNTNNYYNMMRTIDTHQTEYHGGLMYNFWVSDDGKVFEGIGWNSFNYLRNGGLGPRSLIIGFIKKDRDSEPSAAAIKAFNEFLRSAICKKILLLHYSLVPYYLIYDRVALGNDSFERKDIKKWNSYTECLDFLFPLETNEMRNPEIVPKAVWRNINPKGDLMTLSFPIEYIIIRQRGARCFFNCTNYLNIMERNNDLRHETFPFNFLLSEEGRVYEVMGWGKTWEKSYQKKKAIEVGFLGNFHSYGPSKPIFLALNALIQDGLRSGKLSTHYNIVTIKTVDPEKSNFLGDFLENEIRKLDRYTENY